MAEREHVAHAIRINWTAETCAPGQFTEAIPAKGQCDVSSFVAWQYLGGELVLGKVYLDGEEVEHHYWNRIDGEDLDLTREQFVRGEQIVEEKVISGDFLVENMDQIRPELRERIHTMSTTVSASLGQGPPRP